MSTDLSKRRDGFPTLQGVILAMGLATAFGLTLNFFLASRSPKTQQSTVQPQLPISSQPSLPLNDATNESDQSNPGVSWKLIEDKELGVSFKVPSNWKIESHTVPKGTIEKGVEAYDVDASKNAVEVINFQKDNDWTIRVTLRKNFEPMECGGLQGYTREKFDEQLNKFKRIPFLGVNAYRTALENGEFWQVAEQSPSYPQPIFFEGQPYRVTDVNNLYYGQYLFDFAFCYENFTVPLEAKIVYLSNTFSSSNITGKKLDYSTIQEMDGILGSFILIE